MLKRIYIDNFGCFVDFQCRPQPKQVIFGANASGKSSFMDALLTIRDFLRGANPVTGAHRTLWLDRTRQTFELEAELDGNRYEYRVIFETSGDPPKTRVSLESVHIGDRLSFLYREGEMSFPSHFSQSPAKEGSALAQVPKRRETARLIVFRDWLMNIEGFRLNPFGMAPFARREEIYPQTDLSNFAGWYRHLVQSDPPENVRYLDSLRRSLEGFEHLEAAAYGEQARVLLAEFGGDSDRKLLLNLKELSQGQRCLLSLYAIIHFVVKAGRTAIIDEPENFLGLQQLLPWLISASEAVEGGRGQLMLISQHPEFLSQWAPASSIQFVRSGLGPVKIKEARPAPDMPLAPVELMAQAWHA